MRPLPLALLAIAVLSGCDGGTAQRARSSIEVEPTSVDFGTTAPGARVERPLALLNRGRAPLRVREVTVQGDAAFSADTAGPLEVEPGASAPLTLAYAPAAAGLHTARLVVQSDADNAPELWIALGGSASQADPCATVSCHQPPGPCFEAQGQCAGGTCSYAPSVGALCDDGDGCTVSDACGAAGACAGSPRTCSTPPAATCLDAQTRRTFAAGGSCALGACSYPTTDTACAFGCDAGACQADPCQGVSCANPGACQTGPGVCSGGACSYPALTTCGDGDGCCPGGCTAQTDGDCPGRCPRGQFACGGGCCGASAISAGYGFSCALADGGAKCWGFNSMGEVGDGTTTDRSTPVDVVGLSSGVAALAGNTYHACALLSGGGMKCWGRNLYGELGNGTTNGTSPNPLPVAVQGLPSSVVALSTSFSSTFALTSLGTLSSWGYNEFGELADGTWTHRSLPGAVSGTYQAVGPNCAVTTAGALRCWGWNGHGQVGDGTLANRNVPTQVLGLTSGVTGTDMGWAHACAVVNGGAWCWGYNASGQLGDGTTLDRSQPVAVSGLGSGVAKVNVGDDYSCALTTAGEVRCWGGNAHGQLGDGTRTQRSSPAAVAGLSGIVDVAAGVFHACALSSAGEVRCWGYNWYGSLGNGATQNGDQLTPVGVLTP